MARSASPGRSGKIRVRGRWFAGLSPIVRRLCITNLRRCSPPSRIGFLEGGAQGLAERGADVAVRVVLVVRHVANSRNDPTSDPWRARRGVSLKNQNRDFLKILA